MWKLHDDVDIKSLTNTSFNVDNCDYCKHQFVIPIRLDINEITRYNSKVANIHNNEMNIWKTCPLKKVDQGQDQERLLANI